MQTSVCTLFSAAAAAAGAGWRQSAVNYVSLRPCMATSDLGRHANVLGDVLEVCIIKVIQKKKKRDSFKFEGSETLDFESKFTDQMM